MLSGLWLSVVENIWAMFNSFSMHLNSCNSLELTLFPRLPQDLGVPFPFPSIPYFLFWEPWSSTGHVDSKPGVVWHAPLGGRNTEVKVQWPVLIFKENSMKVPSKKLKIKWLYGPATPLAISAQTARRIEIRILNSYLYPHVHHSLVHSNQDMEAT